VSGPEIVGPDLCRGGQGQLLFGPDLGVGPGPDLDRTYFLCESNVFCPYKKSKEKNFRGANSFKSPTNISSKTILIVVQHDIHFSN
jgi:hypothetical protein